MDFNLQLYQDSHRVNGLAELEALAEYCINHGIEVERISKDELDASIDPETTTANCVLESEGGVCLKFTAHSGAVITVRFSEYLMELYCQRSSSERHPDSFP
jgi:hypothetical protein